MTADKREPTDEEWAWVGRRLRESTRWAASYSIMNMVWSAVHEHDWSLPEVSEFRIELRRYVESTGDREQMVIWRDQRGRFKGAEFHVIKPVSSVRRMDQTIARFSAAPGAL